MLFKKTASYNRAGSIEAAGEANARGKVKKAIAEYKKVLEADPKDQVAHMKIAPLLAASKNFTEAWKSFKAAAERYESLGFFNKAVGVYTQAVRCMPREAAVWESLAGLYLAKGRKADAISTLLKAHLNFRSRKLRYKAIKLLKGAFEIEPWSFEPTYALAKLLAKSGNKKEALTFLEGLAEREKKEKRKKALRAAFLIKPSFGTAWRWARG